MHEFPRGLSNNPTVLATQRALIDELFISMRASANHSIEVLSKNLSDLKGREGQDQAYHLDRMLSDYFPKSYFSVLPEAQQNRQLMKFLADKGIPGALGEVAAMYRKGEGGPVDLGQATHYAQLASDQGMTESAKAESSRLEAAPRPEVMRSAFFRLTAQLEYQTGHPTEQMLPELGQNPYWGSSQLPVSPASNGSIRGGQWHGPGPAWGFLQGGGNGDANNTQSWQPSWRLDTPGNFFSH